ncbi:PAS domain-containing sensor histidine kinase [Halorubrum sp. 48-1-W]|nr:PAS domain-containing sensor histidine kinase [Halorubrum sp. 48-1-W]
MSPRSAAGHLTLPRCRAASHEPGGEASVLLRRVASAPHASTCGCRLHPCFSGRAEYRGWTVFRRGVGWLLLPLSTQREWSDFTADPVPTTSPELTLSGASKRGLTRVLSDTELTSEFDSTFYSHCTLQHVYMSPETEEDTNLRGLIESSPDSIVIANPETGEIVEVSQAAETFFGYTQEELYSMDVLALHPADERDRYEDLFKTHFERNPAVISQFDDGSPVFAVTADGDRIPVEINAWAMEDVNHDQPLFQGVFRNISERLRRQRELQRQNEQLDEFASVISHDLRNPLNVAQGRTALLDREYESEHIESLRTALSRMEEIVEDTLALARNGQRVGEMEPVNLVSAIGKCWETVDTSATTLEIEDDLRIRADPDRIQHVCENLLRNAVEHGGDDVTVRIGQADEQTLYFEDDGPGIPEDERDAVFEPGYSSTGGGTGFGLAIVQRIAEAHGWGVTLTNSESGGARFEFTDVEIQR